MATPSSRYERMSFTMPSPSGRLVPTLALLALGWVPTVLPADDAGKLSPEPALTEAQRRHWAFQKPVRPSLPAVQHVTWVRTPLDAFVLAQLEQRGLQPAPPADRATLLRRVTVDLTGLPPTPDE